MLKEINYLHDDLDTANRLIYLGSEINEESAGKFIKSLSILSNLNHKPIDIILNSGGGDWEQGMAIFSFIRRCPAVTRITVVGHAQSMASVILQAGTVRMIDPDAYLMLHDGSLGLSETNARDFEKFAEQSKITRERMYRIYSSKSKKPVSYFRRVCLNDFYVTPERALELGLVDKVLDF